jgi:diguanylate cyclase (GGDEF)-like protein
MATPRTGIEPHQHQSTWTRLARAAPLLSLAVGALAFAAERDGMVSAPVAVAATALAAAIVVGVISRTATRAHSRSEAERRALEATVDELVDRDPLTGVLNDRRLNEELRRQLAFAQRYGSQMAVLCVRLDQVAEIREARGEPIADELVITTAEVLADELRMTDVVTRREPHGFVVLLPQTDEDAARIVAAKLVRRLRGIERARPDGASISLRASIGVALSDPKGFDDAERLVARADRALAAASAAGGDRLAISGDSVTNSEQPVLD